MPESNPKRLLVEGKKERLVIPEFMEMNGIPWGKNSNTWPVYIKEYDGDSKLLDPGNIEAELKTQGLRVLGIIADADNNAEDRWKSIRQRGLKSFPGLPEPLPEEGLIWKNADGLLFGAWVMPDNRSRGMLETLLHSCVPDSQQPLWTFVEKMCIDAKTHGAPYRDVHFDKARIHAWLALQDEPGLQLHQAVPTNTLKPQSPHAAKFVQWFRSLFGL